MGEIEAEAHVVGEAEPGQQAGLLEHQRAARMGLGQRLVEKTHLTGGRPFEPGQHVSVTLREGAFRTLDVARCMAAAARDGLLRTPPTP